MLTDTMEQHFEKLPAEEFTKVWGCIESLDKATAGLDMGVVVLATEYLRARMFENIQQTVRAQVIAISGLEQQRAQLQHDAGTDARTFTQLKIAYEDTYRRLERANKRIKKLKSK